MEYQRKNRIKFLIVFHFNFVVKYRNPLLVEYGQRIKEIFNLIAKKSYFSIKKMEVERDHIHVLVSSLPRLSPSQIVRRLKMESTRQIWHEHPELSSEFWKKKPFWSDGYFCTSIGNTSIKIISQYIENQG